MQGYKNAKVRGASLLASVLADTAGRSEESSVAIAALRSAVLVYRVALPLVCVAWYIEALRLNRDLLAEELDLIFPFDYHTIQTLHPRESVAGFGCRHTGIPKLCRHN
jgi:hypothetical protein